MCRHAKCNSMLFKPLCYKFTDWLNNTCLNGLRWFSHASLLGKHALGLANRHNAVMWIENQSEIIFFNVRKVLINIFCDTWHPINFWSGENNLTWYPMILCQVWRYFLWYLVSDLILNGFCIRWKYLHLIPNDFSVRFLLLFIVKPDTQWFWYQVKIITPDTQCFWYQVPPDE